MTFLLVVNVLIALLDPAHFMYSAARDWFRSAGHRRWATCPITENGLIPIAGHPRYPNSPGPPAVVASLLRDLRLVPGRELWPDAPSLLDANPIRLSEIKTTQQITDTYLLALAVSRGGRLATLDRRLSTKAVVGGERALHLIA